MRTRQLKTPGACETGPIPFPNQTTRETSPADPGHFPQAERALAAVETMSRQLQDLARELNCLGYFDGDDDRPRAA